MDLHAVIVDDDSVDRMVMRRALARSGLFGRISEFENGVAFLERLDTIADRERAIVFLDLHMPILSGFDVIERLAGESGARRFGGVVIVTTSSAPGDIEMARRLPDVIEFVCKPLEAQVLESIASVAFGEAKGVCEQAD